MQLPITLATASALTLIFLVLSLLVVRARFATKTSLGDGSKSDVAAGKDVMASPLLVATRRQGNFAEYVPLSLLLIGLLEGSAASRTLVSGLAIALLAGRVLHPFGLGRPSPNVFRATGILLQWLVLLVAGLCGLSLSLLR